MMESTFSMKSREHRIVVVCEGFRAGEGISKGLVARNPVSHGFEIPCWQSGLQGSDPRSTGRLPVLAPVSHSRLLTACSASFSRKGVWPHRAEQPLRRRRASGRKSGAMLYRALSAAADTRKGSLRIVYRKTEPSTFRNAKGRSRPVSRKKNGGVHPHLKESADP